MEICRQKKAGTTERQTAVDEATNESISIRKLVKSDLTPSQGVISI
jgi:hypothetical protein